MKHVGLIVSIVLLVPLVTHAQDAVNAGFVEGLWYSEKPIFAGETVRIYAVLRNNTESDLTGTVTFKDGNSVISEKDVSALSGRLIETWADWTPTYGEHTIRAELHDIELHSVGEGSVRVNAESGVSESFIFIDRDTDGDGIGNSEDTDDDNDGISDEEETAQGTDPLSPDTTPTASETATSTEDGGTESSAAKSTNETEDTHTPKEGLERYFDGGVANTVLSNVTERVRGSKERLDAYRKTRRQEKEETGTSTPGEPSATSTDATTTDSETATITRTHIGEESRGLVGTLVAGVASIFDSLYTLLLWITSKLLAYPGLVQFLLLLGILIGTYKLAKRYGARQQ